MLQGMQGKGPGGAGGGVGEADISGWWVPAMVKGLTSKASLTPYSLARKSQSLLQRSRLVLAAKEPEVSSEGHTAGCGLTSSLWLVLGQTSPSAAPHCRGGAWSRPPMGGAPPGQHMISEHSQVRSAGEYKEQCLSPQNLRGWSGRILHPTHFHQHGSARKRQSCSKMTAR